MVVFLKLNTVAQTNNVIDNKTDKNKMENVDKSFNRTMHYDIKNTDQSFGTTVASVNTRNICFSPDHHDIYPTIPFPEEFKIDTKPFVSRPFFVENLTWSTQPIFTQLPLATRKLPRDVFTSNPSLENALKLGAYFRSDLSLSVSVAGTISHAGTLLVGILPPLSYSGFNNPNSVYLVNTIMSGPHCFLHANEATSAVLHVPWYCNTDVASLDMRPIAPAQNIAFGESNAPGNYATLVVMVLSPLSPSTGASTSLNLTIEATFNALDIYVPSPRYLNFVTQGFSMEEEVYRKTTTSDEDLSHLHDYVLITQGLQSIASAAIDATTAYTKQVVGDAIDTLRSGIKFYTGLHNPNIPLINNRMIVAKRNFPNNTTGEQFFEKLDPYPEIDRIVDRPIYNTSVDEMSIKHILSKPQYIGRFRVNSADTVGKLLWANAISPRQGGFSSTEWVIANNIELFHYLSRAWRGSIKIHIQSVMNNKQQIKLRLLQLYNPSGQILAGYPTYSSILSAPSHLMEFTSGGEIQTVELPYLCRNDLTPCSPDLSFDALFHGMYYIYVAQSLANSNDSPVDINFNVFISAGDDLTFHGYSTEVATQIPFAVPALRTNNLSEKTRQVLSMLDKDAFVSQGLEVMNEPQNNQTLESSSDAINMVTTHQERLFSPVDIRPLIRRMYPTSTIVLSEGPNIIDLKDIIGERVTGSPITPMQIITGMFYGKTLGLKVKLRTFDETSLTVMFVPPQCNIDSALGVIRESSIGTSNVFSPFLVGKAGYSFPFLEMASDAQVSKIFEFVVPNTSVYKFIGSPDKFTSTPVSNLSIGSFGTLVVWSTLSTKANLFVGMTDESRLGFHCIAPIIRPVLDAGGANSTIYKGATGLGPTVSPPVAQSLFTKFARI